MSIAVTPDEELEDTVAELLERLGGISPARVLLRPSLGAATEADLLRLLDSPNKRLCELIDGVLVEKVMGLRESLLASVLIELIRAFVRPLNLGIVTAPDGPLRLFGGRIRMPDVSFISWNRLPGRKVPKAAIPDLAPNLAIEILSESNTPKEMELKRQDYFKAGTDLYWEIDPRAKTVQVYTSLESFTTLSEADTLDGGDVLPGFRLPLADLFAELDRHG